MTTEIPLLRTSERNDYKRCPWLWEQTWLRGLRPRREPTWAWFGTAIHAALEARYPIGRKRGKRSDVHDAFDAALGDQERKVYSAGGEMDPDEVVDARALGHAMLEGYIAEYGKDPDWQVLHTEQPFQIDVPHPDNPDEILVVYAGTWDLAVFDLRDKCYRIVDHKTRRSFPTNWNFYNINDQAGSYLWVAREVLIHKGILKPSDELDGLVFNALRKKMPDNRPQDADGKYLNKNGSVSKVQPAPLFHRETVYRSPQERVTQAHRVQAEALHMNAIRSGALPVFKTPTEECNRCLIFEYCELHEQNPEDAEEFAQGTLLHRDPYRDHREQMEAGGIVL